MNLKELRTSPPPETPELVKQIAQKYVKNNEKYNIFPQKLNMNNNESFYFVTYYFNTDDPKGFLLINENGSLPIYQDCIELFNSFVILENGLFNVFAYGEEWSKRPLKPWKKLQSILNSLSNIVYSSEDDDFKKGYEVFCSVPKTMLETQQALIEIVDKAIEYHRELTTNYTFTTDFTKKVDDNFRLMMDIMRKQFEVQFDTEPERTIFMKKLKETTSPFNPMKWTLYLRLRKYHKWLNADDTAMNLYNEFKQDVYREKVGLDKRNKQLENIRNPRS